MPTILTEWGLVGARKLSAAAKVLVIVDVLSFSTCVDIATTAGAFIYPRSYDNLEEAKEAAALLGAEIAGPRGDPNYRYCLSPESLVSIERGFKLVLPSPNGSAISAVGHNNHVLAGCLRNAKAVADAAMKLAGGQPIAVIPAGERWPDGSMRPAIEDWLGAGAIIAELEGNLSAEAEIAHSAFLGAAGNLSELLHGSVSGQELINRGYPGDVAIATKLNESVSAPRLIDGAYRA